MGSSRPISWKLFCLLGSTVRQEGLRPIRSPSGCTLELASKQAREPESRILADIAHVGDSRRCAIEFRNRDLERLVVAHGAVAQNRQGNLLAQQDRPVSRAAEVDAGMNSMPERNVVRELVQLAVDIQSV